MSNLIPNVSEPARHDDMGPFLRNIVLTLGFVLFCIFAGCSSIKIVQTGQQGVVTRFGAIQGDTLKPGLHIVTPFVDRVIQMDIREQKEQTDAATVSKDLQEVTTTVALNYRLDPGPVGKLYAEIGRNYREIIIDPAIQESLKAVTSRYNVEELVTRRQEVKALALENPRQRLSPKYIIVDELSIVNFSFSKDFTEAVERKQVAQQNALKAEQDLSRIRTEGQQKLALAEAEAAGLRAQREAITPELLKLREIENMKAMIEKWDGKLPEYMMGGQSPFVLMDMKGSTK